MLLSPRTRTETLMVSYLDQVAIHFGPRAEHLAIVEQVRDGTQLRVRLLLDDQHHQFVNLVSFDPLHLLNRADSRLLLEPRVHEQVVEMTAHPPSHGEKR